MTRLLLILAALMLGGCGGGAVAAPEGTPAVTLHISAEASVFDTDRLAVPAGVPFALRFANRDAVPHNVSIRGAAGTQVGEIFSGPAERTHIFEGLPAGTYTFLCDVHPEMNGTLEASAGGSRP